MAKIHGENTCSECGKTHKWEYILSQRLSSSMIVETLNSSYAHPALVDEDNTGRREFRCRCKFCDKVNRFEYNDPNNT